MYKLPVYLTIGEAYRFVAGQFSALLAYIIVPIFVSSLLSAATTFSAILRLGGINFVPGVYIYPNLHGQLPQLFELSSAFVAVPLSIFLAILYFATYVLFAVAWHRRYLVGPDLTSSSEIFIWRHRHMRFMWKGILLYILFVLAVSLAWFAVGAAAGAILTSVGVSIAQPPGIIIQLAIMAIVAGIPTALLLSSVLLVFPAAAIDKTNIGIFASRHITRGHVWRITFIMFGIWIPFAILNWGFDKLFLLPDILEYWIGSLGLGFVVILIKNVIAFLTAAIGVSALSIIYRRLTDNVHVAETPISHNR